MLLLLFTACKSNDDFCLEQCEPGEDIYVCSGSMTNNRICALSSNVAVAQCGPLGVVGKYECGAGGDEAGDEGGSPSEDPAPEDGGPQSEWSPDDFVWFDRETGATIVARELIDIIAADGGIIVAHDSTSLVPLEAGHYQLKTVGPDDLAHHLGFADGDIIRSANGIDLSKASDYMLAIGALAGESALKVVVTRSGEPHSVVIHIQ